MKRTIITAILFLGTLVLFIEPASCDGVLRVHPTNSRYFTDNSGKVIYLTGSHTWSNFFEEAGDSNNFDYTGYLNFLIARNHNFIRSWSWVAAYSRNGTFRPYSNAPLPWPRTGPGNAADSRPKFDLQRFDQAYFDRLRSRIIAARERNIFVSIMFFEGWCLAGEETSDSRQCWTWHPFRDVNNINGINGDTNGDGKGFEFFKGSAPTAVKNLQKAYIKKTVDTVNDLDNVLYEIVNEASPESTSWQYEMITYLKTYQSTKPKQHPIGMTSRLGDPDDDDLFASAADWISPGKNSSDQYTTSFPAADGRKVMILDNDHLLSSPDRDWVWKGFLRGLNPIFMESTDLLTDTDSRKQGVRDAMGHTLSYAKRMNLSLSTPRESLASTAYCLANPGQEYLVYQPASASFTVNLTAGNYTFEWFNTVSGKITATGSANAGGGNYSFSPPFSGAVLYITRKSALPVCGNGIVESGEQCDNGTGNGICPQSCSTTCTTNTSCAQTEIPKSSWTIHSATQNQSNHPPQNAIDGNITSFYNSNWDNPQSYPQQLTFNLGASYQNISRLTYTPFQGGSGNARVNQYSVYISENPESWGSAVASGSFPCSSTAQQSVNLTAKTGRYLKFEIRSSHGYYCSGSDYSTAVAELGLFRSTNGTATPGAPSGLKVR